jgi:hypothetical protein
VKNLLDCQLAVDDLAGAELVRPERSLPSGFRSPLHLISNGRMAFAGTIGIG